MLKRQRVKWTGEKYYTTAGSKNILCTKGQKYFCYNKYIVAIKIKNNSDLANIRKLTPTTGAKIYASLRADVTSAGILDRDYRYYTFLSLLDMTGFIFFIYQFIIQRNPLLVILSCLGISFFTVRIGGLVHDAGHRAIFSSPLINDIYAYLCSSLIAFPYKVWKVKHNAHHAHTNEEGGDPDLEVPISFTQDMASRNTLAVRFMRKYQAWLYYPLGALVSYTMRLKAFKFYKENFDRETMISMSIQLVGMFLWYIVPFFIFPFWKALVFFILTNEIAGLYMLQIFAPNHKGMPQLEKGLQISFLEHQIITARNIYSHWFTDYFYLGLNYQVEHHLFPYCPRNKLNKITPFVLAICKKYKLDYIQMGILESTQFILSELKKTSDLTQKKRA